MNRIRPLTVVAALMLISSPAPAALAAQEAPRTETAPPAANGPTRNVQVEVTITLQGAEPGGASKKMTLVAADRQLAQGRSGIEVAVRAGPPGEIQYRPVGLNVDATPQVDGDQRIRLVLRLTFSTILKAESTDIRPSFGNSETQVNLVLDSGKPLVISQAMDAELGRGYSIEVKATILK